MSKNSLCGVATAVDTAVGLASQGVDRIAANAQRFGQAADFGALAMFSRVALPAATAMSGFVERIEEGSSKLARRVAGQPAVVKAAAKRAKPVRKTAGQTASKPSKKVVASQKAGVRKTAATARRARAAVAEPAQAA
jgi:hypothetical protein